MGRPSDREFELKRRLRELEEKNRQLEAEIVQLKKKLSKLEEPKERKTVPAKEKGCPLCGAKIKSSTLPFGTLQICEDKCGWREVKNGKA